MRLEREYGKLQKTPTQKTPGGGAHIFFRLSKGVQKYTSIEQIGEQKGATDKLPFNDVSWEANGVVDSGNHKKSEAGPRKRGKPEEYRPKVSYEPENSRKNCVK
jgi:hypothetical protein